MKTLVKYEDVVEKLRAFDEFGEIGECVTVVRMRSNGDDAPDKNNPVQADCMAVMLVMSGGMDIEVNMDYYRVEEDSMLVIPPRTLVNIRGVDHGSTDVYLLCMAQSFLHEININYAALSVPSSVPFEKPSAVRRLTSRQSCLFKRYFDLMYDVAHNQANMRIDLNIASSLVSAMVYQAAQFYYKELADNSPRSEAPGNRPSNYVNEFIRLLQLHYMNERSVTFYADKLFISPKYLSLLVKKATGRSASRWIDDRVIMEARNLLRYSGKNIQQVAYMLNFSNQSSFGKYFKHLTGMSPTEYQKS